MNRPFSVLSPGWTNPTKYEYSSNGANIEENDSHTLFKHISIDGNENQTIIFTDKIGRTIVERQAGKNGTSPFTTLTKYDLKNRITSIIPPIKTSESDVDGFSYNYTYYGNDLIKTKKFPDKDLVEYRYNKRDLVANYRDGFLNGKSKWMGTEYDDWGRPLKEGFSNSPISNNSATDPTINTILSEYTYGFGATTKDKIIKEKRTILDVYENYNSNIEYNYLYNSCGLLKDTYSNNLLNPNVTNSYRKTISYDRADNILVEDLDIHDGIKNHDIITTRTVDFAGRNLFMFYSALIVILNCSDHISITSLTLIFFDRLYQSA